MTLLPLLLTLCNCAPTSNADWPVFGGDADGSRFSALRQIDVSNVAKLKVAWTFHTGEQTGDIPIQCTPIVVEGGMYVVTAGHRVLRLNPVTGKPVWSFDTNTANSRSGHTRASRGVAYWSDGLPRGLRRILFGTPDGRLLSLDALTGKPDPKFKIVDLHTELGPEWQNGYVGVSAAPTVIGDLVTVGIANDEGPGSAPGTIMAFSVKTGKRVWSFDVLPKKGQYGIATWRKGTTEGSGAAGAWTGYVVDSKRGILFASTGSASPDFDGTERPGDNLFANCIIALDARTGKRLWHFQTVHHDLWDHDNASPPLLCTVRRGGRQVDAVSLVTKTGFCFLFDRVTGRPLFEVREVPAPPSTIPGEEASPTQPEPVLPAPLTKTLFTKDEVTDLSPESRAHVLKRIETLLYGQKYLPPARNGTVVSPGYIGGSPWSGGSFDSRTNTLYVNTNNVPAIVANPANYEFLTDHEGYPGVKPPWGLLTAIDLNTGRFRWQVPLGEYKELTRRGHAITGTPNLGGSLVTAGNLLFIGSTCDATFRAFDTRTGKIVFESALPASAFAAPSTYEVNGRQYVIIAASGGGHAKRFGLDRGPLSDTFVCFALPK